MTTQKKLTKRTIEALPIPAEGPVTYRDDDDRYLNIVIHPQGRRTWRYIRKVTGRTRFYTLGTYPEMTPDMARHESKRVSGEYDAGRDPAQEKRAERNLLTWPDLFNWFIENHSKPHKRSWEQDVDIERLHCEQWQRKPYTAITTDLVTRWHKQIGENSGKHAADRVLALVKTVFREALDNEVVKGKNPAATVHKFYTSAAQYGRDRFLSGDELGRLLRTLSEYNDRNMADFFSVCLFTGARRGNVQAMRWADMDRTDPTTPKWIIPGSVSKNGEPMTIPLLPPVLEILNRRHEDQLAFSDSPEFVFPSRRGGATRHLTEPKKAWAAICKTAELENVRIHDLRRTLGSWQALLGASLQIIGRSLGHKSIQSTAVYARLNDDPVRASMAAATTAMIEAGKKGVQK